MRGINFLLLILYWLNKVNSMALVKRPLSYGDSFDSEVVQILNNNNYFPNEDNMPKTSMKNIDNDATYILSKLSDDVLLKLLNQQPKKNEYDLNDVLNIIGNGNTEKANNLDMNDKDNKYEPQGAVFRLEDQEVQPYNYNNAEDPKQNAFKKLNNMLYSRPQELNFDDDDKQKEMLFNVLVSQLKSLCCKKSKPKINKNIQQLNNLMKKETLSQKSLTKLLPNYNQQTDKSTEQLFLVINDEIRSNVTDDLVSVDPDTLSRNSSVLLLGPINTPLTDVQLKLVMTRIGNELSKPEYLPLLQRLSEGAVDDLSWGLTKSLLTGPDSRRYIKPHRCNHQSKLARVYGGVKWLLCTGYLNLNGPSLYD